MHKFWVAAAMLLAGLVVQSHPLRADVGCSEPERALGVERVVDIDPTSGPLFGDISVLTREDSFLQPREVVLTFDDGPMPWITRSILDTLDRFCTKATFFAVGRMAIAYPATVKDVLERGHTLGSHTWSHPLNMKRRGLQRAVEEIEKGFSAIALAAGQPISPFFRFPGLSDSDPMMAHLQSRGIAAFTVDVVSNDSYIGSADRLASYTLAEIEQRQGGIVLFHDIKSATAKALPTILAGLKQRGYKVVHIRSTVPLDALDTYDSELKPLLAKAQPPVKATLAAASGSEISTPHLMPFFGSPAVLKTLSGQEAPITTLSPPARQRSAATARDHQETVVAATHGARPAGRKAKTAKTKRNREQVQVPVSLFGF